MTPVSSTNSIALSKMPLPLAKLAKMAATTPNVTPSSWIMANRKVVSKILTSTQLQEGLRRHQILAG
jgi:hypothetical protein